MNGAADSKMAARIKARAPIFPARRTLDADVLQSDNFPANVDGAILFCIVVVPSRWMSH
ncbi:MAG: hypothetical protein ACTHLY_14610 [Pseudolabrys sp.]